MKVDKKLFVGSVCCLMLAAGCADDNGSTTSDTCGNGICESNETSVSCPSDCTIVSGCGNGVCDAGETSQTCPSDCAVASTCGNGVCDEGETYATCSLDCSRGAVCGDNVCDEGESTQTCPSDCPRVVRCGDGVCDSSENRQTCPTDCAPVCGDGLCEGGEYPDNCPDDCATITDTEYEAICGDGVCDDEEKTSCPADCGTNDDQVKLTLDEFNELKESNFRFMFDYGTMKSPDTTSNTTKIEDFFAFPYPNALRTDMYGRPDLSQYPLPNLALLEQLGAIMPSLSTLVPSLVELVQSEREGFPPIGGVYFRSAIEIDSSSLDSNYSSSNLSATRESNSCFQLINVEKDSKHYGERVPVYVTYHRMTNELWAKNTLVMRPVPGVGPHPGDRYAAVVTNCLTSNGRSLNPSNKLRHILNGTAPDEVMKPMAYYVEQLKAMEADGTLGFKLSDIRAMTGYDTMNPATEMDQMAEALKGKGYIVADENGVALPAPDASSTGWTTYPGYNAHVFRGQFVTCNFIEGDYSGDVPDYTVTGGGKILFSAKGKLRSTCHEEKVYFEVSVPRATDSLTAFEMPEKGFPIAVYGHGTGGDAGTHSRYSCSEGLILLRNKVPTAMIGFDACLQGKRTLSGGDEAELYMMMLQNPVVIRESVRQTVNDMLVLYDIIDNGKLILPPLPGTSKNVIFDPSYGLYMGHSQGSQEAGLLLGLTDSIKNAFLSAGGGGVLMAFVDLQLDLSSIQVVGQILDGMSIADMLAMIFGLEKGSISYDTFITDHIVQPLMDPIDPLNFTPRFIKEPANGGAPKNIAQTVGLGDRSTPTVTQYAMIASTGLPFIGKVYEASNDAIKLAGLDKSVGSSVIQNISTDNGTATGAAMQFDYTGTSNPHFVIYNMASARNAYINFFKSAISGKTKVSVSGSQKGDK